MSEFIKIENDEDELTDDEVELIDDEDELTDDEVEITEVEFNQYYKKKSFFDKFVKPMISWSEFDKALNSNTKKFQLITGTIDFGIDDDGKGGFFYGYTFDEEEYTKDEESGFTIFPQFEINVDSHTKVKKKKSQEIDSNKIYPFSIIVSNKRQKIEIPTASDEDADFIFEYISEKIDIFKDKSNNENKTSKLKERLIELDELLKEGILTKEEYELKRKLIIEQY